MRSCGGRFAARKALPALPATAATTTTAATTAVATTAAATSTAAAAVAAATTAASTTTEATTATTTAAAPILGLFDGDLAPLHVATVQLLDCLTRLVLGRHLDEPEAARTAGLAVRDDLGIRDRAQAREELAEVQLGDV